MEKIKKIIVKGNPKTNPELYRQYMRRYMRERYRKNHPNSRHYPILDTIPEKEEDCECESSLASIRSRSHSYSPILNGEEVCFSDTGSFYPNQWESESTLSDISDISSDSYLSRMTESSIRLNREELATLKLNELKEAQKELTNKLIEQLGLRKAKLALEEIDSGLKGHHSKDLYMEKIEILFYLVSN